QHWPPTLRRATTLLAALFSDPDPGRSAMIRKDNDNEQVKTLEKGNIYFIFRPEVEEHRPRSLDDVQRLYMVLSPEGGRSHRMALIGQKQLPDPDESGHHRYWGFIDKVSDDPAEIANEFKPFTYQTKTRGE